MHRVRHQAALAWSACLTLLLCVIAIVARQEDVAGRRTGEAITPAIAFASRLGHWLIANVHIVVLTFALCVMAIAAAAAIMCWRADGKGPGVAIFAIVGLATAAQAAFLWHFVALGIAFVVGAVVCGIALRPSGSVATSEHFGWADAAILLVLTLCAAIVRFYALNQLPNVFEGELAPYYLASTNLRGIPLGNAGVSGPWAPLGFLFYVPVFVATTFFGPTLLAVRFSTAAVSLITLALLYTFALVGFGRVAAVFTGIFFVFDPLQIGWGRTDVHPHGVTTWPAVLICLTTLAAFKTDRVRWFAILAALMALSWHQYPSGQTAALIPLFVLGATSVSGERVPRLAAKIALLAAGLVAWIAGSVIADLPVGVLDAPLRYFQRLDTRVLWNRTDTAQPLIARLEAVFANAATLTSDLVAGLFVQLRYTFHQDIFIPIGGWPSRSVPWIVGALAIAGVCLFTTRRRRTTADWVLAAWVVAAILPAVFSDRAYPKRAATLFPALFVCAGAVASEFLTAMRGRLEPLRIGTTALAALGVGAWFCTTSYLWFSGLAMQYGKPNETIVAEQIANHLKPGTIVVADLWHGYGRGKLTYLLSGVLRDSVRQPVFWYVRDWDRDLRSIMEHPELSVRYADSNAFYYRWSGLSPLVAATDKEHAWRQVIFVLQTGLDTPKKLQVVRNSSSLQYSDAERLALLDQLYPGCRPQIVPPVHCEDCGYVIATCPLRH
jgi:dolichyl-phosphate-mannose-protein mannosyltransferase